MSGRSRGSALAVGSCDKTLKQDTTISLRNEAKGTSKRPHCLTVAVSRSISLPLLVFVHLFASSHSPSNPIANDDDDDDDERRVQSSRPRVRRHLSKVTRLILYSPSQLPVNFYSFVVRPRLFKLSCHNASLSRNKALLYGKL